MLKAELGKAIADGDTALDGKIADLGKALENAISAYGAADEALKAELIAKIEAADAALDGAIKAIQKDLDEIKAALEEKNGELAEKPLGLWNYRRIQYPPFFTTPRNEVTLLNWPQNDYWMGNIFDDPDAGEDQFFPQ